MHTSIGDDLTHFGPPAALAGPGDHDNDNEFSEEEDESDLDDLEEWDDEEDDDDEDDEYEDWEDDEEDVAFEDEE